MLLLISIKTPKDSGAFASNSAAKIGFGLLFTIKSKSLGLRLPMGCPWLSTTDTPSEISCSLQAAGFKYRKTIPVNSNTVLTKRRDVPSS
jgi:hypothetical protein